MFYITFKKRIIFKNVKRDCSKTFFSKKNHNKNIISKQLSTTFSKKNLEMCIYHIKKLNFDKIKTLFKRDDLKLFMFLNKMLLLTKIKY